MMYVVNYWRKDARLQWVRWSDWGGAWLGALSTCRIPKFDFTSLILYNCGAWCWYSNTDNTLTDIDE